MINIQPETAFSTGGSDRGVVGNGRFRAPRISVCVAVYNVAPYLEECLESLRSQTFKDAEFLVVDDGSTDGSAEICQRFAQRDSRFILLRSKENRGLLMARKTAIESLRGECALFLDGDDRLTSPEALAQAWRLMEAHPEADIIKFSVECFGGDDEQRRGMRKWLNGGRVTGPLTASEYLDAVFIRGGIAWNVWDKLYRAPVLKAALPHIPDEYFVAAEDAFLTFLFAQNVRNALVLKEPRLYAYRLASGVSTSVVSLSKFVRHFARETRIIGWMEAYARAEGREALCRQAINACLRRLLRVQARRFKQLPRQDRAEAFAALVKEGRVTELVTVFMEENSFVDKGVNVKRCCHGKAVKYFVLSKLALTRAKRLRYRDKLARYIAL